MKKKDEYTVENFKKELNEPKKRVEMNLDLDYWKKRFLYPYALDTAPLKFNDG
jgi:hypothetical protein